MSNANTNLVADSQIDEALGSLPRDVELKTDLWPSIRAQIEAESPVATRRDTLGATGSQPFAANRFISQIAAGLVLVAVTAIITYQVARQPAAIIASNSLTGATDEASLGANYLKARAELDRLFAERIATLPLETRTKLLANLADLRRASDEITATLAQHPADPLLQDLLISTRQRELRLLADVSQLNISDSQRTAS